MVEADPDINDLEYAPTSGKDCSIKKVDETSFAS